MKENENRVMGSVRAYQFIYRFILVLLLLQQGLPAWAQNKKPVALPVGIKEGYTDKFTYVPGETSTVYLLATAKGKISLRLMTADNQPIDTVQVELAALEIKNKEPYMRGYGLPPAFTYKIPELKTGLYHWENTEIHFLVKSPSKKSDLVILYPSNTEQAYSAGGGKSLYDKLSSEHKRTYKVSFHRPMSGNSSSIRMSEGFVRWIKGTKYNYRFISDLEMEDYDEIAKSKVLVIIGHSEYWTRKARANFDKFVRAGKDVMVLSGNTMWWQVRYNPDRTMMTCYKDSILDSIKNPLFKTITWNKGSLKYPIYSSIGAQFNGYGMKKDNGWNGYKIATPQSPLLEGTNLKKGEILSCPSGEIDAARIKGFDPEGFPIIDSAAMSCKRIELIGFDKCSWGDKETVQTFVVYQRTKKTGCVINVGSTDWCAYNTFYGPAQQRIIKITSNMIDLLLAGKSVFSSSPVTIAKTNARKKHPLW